MFRSSGVELMFAEIRQSLHDFGVDFDVYFHENSLYESGAVEQSVDRNTVLAADRNVLAAERTYAAWVRTGLAALVAGGGAKALMSGILPGLWGTGWARNCFTDGAPPIIFGSVS